MLVHTPYSKLCKIFLNNLNLTNTFVSLNSLLQYYLEIVYYKVLHIYVKNSSIISVQKYHQGYHNYLLGYK